MMALEAVVAKTTECNVLLMSNDYRCGKCENVLKVFRFFFDLSDESCNSN